MILKGWKTRLYALANGLAGLLVAIDPSVISSATSDDAATRRFGFVMMAQGATVYLLRQVTTTPPPPVNPWAKTND